MKKAFFVCGGWEGPELLRAAEEVGAEWYVAEQDDPRAALEDVEISLKAMRGLSTG